MQHVFHEFLTNNVCKNFEIYFEVIESKTNTRNNGTLIRLPRGKLEVTCKSFFYQGGYQYNTLPGEIRSEKKKNIKILKQKSGNFKISKISGLGYSLF